MNDGETAGTAGLAGLPLGLPEGAALVAGSLTLARAAWEGDHAWPHAADSIPAAGWDEDPLTLAVAAARALALPEKARQGIDKITIISSQRDFPVHLLPVALDLGRVPEEQIVVEYTPDWSGASELLSERARKSGPDAILLAATTHAEVGPAVPALAAAVVAGHAPKDGPAPRAGRLVDWQEFLAASRIQSPDPTGGVSQGAFVSPEVWYGNAAARLRLEGQKCAGCGHVLFPPRESCPACRGTQLRPQPLTGRGTLESVTTVSEGAGPGEFDVQQEETGAYDVAIVALEEGPRTVAMLADVEPGNAAIGDPMEFVVRRIYVQDGVTRYGYKFRPVRP